MERYRELKELTRTWKAPAELTISTPREVKLSGGGIAIACLAALMFLGAVAAQVTLTRLRATRVEQNRVLTSSGVQTKTVVTRQFRSGGDNSERRTTDEFQHEGPTYHGTTRAPRAIWQRLAEGSSIEIRFAPENPAINHP